MTKYGFSIDDWNNAIAEATSVLSKFAKQRKMIPYSDFIHHIKSIKFEAPNDTRLRHFLGEISRIESKAGRGMLTALVVHKGGDYQPGPGFFNIARDLGHEFDDIEKFWIQEVKKVFQAWS